MALLGWLAPFLVAGAIGRFIFLAVPDDEAVAAQRRLGVAGVKSEVPSLILRLLRPLLAAGAPVMAKLKLEGYRKWIDRKFVTAGMAGDLTTDEFFTWKILFAIFFALLVRLTIASWFSLAWYWPFLLSVLGFFYPDIWLDGAAKGRQRKILRELPYVMDLLTLSVEAGLDFVSSLAKVVEKTRSGPLRDELAYYLNEIQVGTTRAQALRNLAWRSNMIQISSFATMLILADQLGASIGRILRAQSDLLRAQRFSKAEEKGAQASVKILFPLILCIMPAVFLVIFGPIALSYIYLGGPPVGAE